MWGETFGEDGGAGCSDAISLNATACAQQFRNPPVGYTNGLGWDTPLWTQVSLGWHCHFDRK